MSVVKLSPVLERLLPVRIDNHFRGNRAALWLLGLHVALKLIMSLNSIFNTRSVATGADGLRQTIGLPFGRLAITFSKFGLGVKGIDVRYTAVHEQEDHPLGAGREMGWPKWRRRQRASARQADECQPAKS